MKKRIISAIAAAGLLAVTMSAPVLAGGHGMRGGNCCGGYNNYSVNNAPGYNSSYNVTPFVCGVDGCGIIYGHAHDNDNNIIVDCPYAGVADHVHGLGSCWVY